MSTGYRVMRVSQGAGLSCRASRDAPLVGLVLANPVHYVARRRARYVRVFCRLPQTPIEHHCRERFLETS